MRSLVIPLVILILVSCGPETVRATGAPVTTQPAAATASSSRTGGTTAPTTTAPSINTGPATATPRTTAPAATSSPGSSAAASPALASCASEQAVRPSAAGVGVPLVVSNNTGARRDVNSLDAQGRRVLSRTLASGEQYTQGAHVGEIWVVSEPGGGCVAVYTVVAPALLILSAGRNSIVPLYAIRGRVTDARTGSALPGQTAFIWMPDESSCAVIGGAGSPGYVVSSITATDGTYGVYVTAGDYKVRIRTAPVGGVSYAARWWRDKPAATAGQCAAADLIAVNADQLAIDFALPAE